MKTRRTFTRRALLKNVGAAGGVVLAWGGGVSAGAAPAGRNPREEILNRVLSTPLIDTHEHLLEESERLRGPARPRLRSDDWSILLSHYLDSDLLVAGMPRKDLDAFLSPGLDPGAKWRLLAPHWPAVKNTGYAQAVRIAVHELYGVEDLSGATVEKVQSGYEQTRRPGFYGRILRDRAKIESCQVNCLSEPFKKSAMPALLMQDLSIVGMFSGPDLVQYASPPGIEVKALSDWHRVIAWWFDTCGKYAVAVKSQNAYGRDIDYAKVPAETAEPVFRKVVQKEPVSEAERKLLEDHLFWQAVEQATAHNLPVKLHTGYYAGQNSMPLARLQHNPASAAELCRLSPDTRFVFMHICYPYYEEMLALAKQWSNAHVDMCWSWLINPVAAKDYLKKHIVSAPLNKVLPFGGDYIPVEPVLGHAALARRGIAQALGELVEESWLTLGDAVELIPALMNGTARNLFQLRTKTEALSQVEWAK
ncbi:MAG TPA: amidohydrolase family protein [Verrucomicrobiae bacterium]